MLQEEEIRYPQSENDIFPGWPRAKLLRRCTPPQRFRTQSECRDGIDSFANDDAGLVREASQGGTCPVRLFRGFSSSTAPAYLAKDSLVVTLFTQREARSRPNTELMLKKTRLVSSGTIIVARANSIQPCDVQNDRIRISVVLPLDQIRALLRSYGESETDLFEALYGVPFKCPTLQGNILRLWQECKSHWSTANLEVDSIILSIVSKLFLKAKATKKGCAAKLSKPIMRRIDAYIQDNCEYTIKTADLAKIAGLSPSHFSRNFSATTGDTPHRYVTKHRLEQAMGELTDNKMSLAEIAFGCGFSSQSHMTQLFRTWFGLTPHQMRVQMNGAVSEMVSKNRIVD